MRIYFFKTTIAKLEQELERARRLNNLRLFKIVKALLMIAEGEALGVISEWLHISERQILNWLLQFMATGFKWLVGHHYRGRGRKAKLTRAQRKRLYELICAGPEKCGFDSGIWTSGMIAEMVFREFQVMYSPRYLCALLKSLDLSYQKAAYESDHLDKEKRREWREVRWPAILKHAKEINGLILFGDEVSFAQWGSLSRTWAPRGEQPEIKTTGKRKAMKIFGAIGFFGGDFHYLETPEKFNAGTYIEFLKGVLSGYRRPVILIQDGARYHNSAEAKAFFEQMQLEGRMYVHDLPAYSPDYNPIEKLWRNTKRAATHCKYFPTFDDLRKAVIKAFEKYMIDATKVIGVMKKLRLNAGLAEAC